ncbi:MAG: hypothetical protein OEV06_09150 [Anaerolineae bacterium]|nr:hypothetical protein [Anaerolineae bacterium]
MTSDAWLVGVGIVMLITTMFFCVGIGAVAWGGGTLETWLLGDLALATAALPVFIWRWGRYRRIVRILINGVTAIGEVARIEQNRTVRVNGRYPWVVRYKFEAGSDVQEGEYQTLDERIGVLRRGYKVHVVYLEENKKLNSLWPFWRGDLVRERELAG